MPVTVWPVGWLLDVNHDAYPKLQLLGVLTGEHWLLDLALNVATLDSIKTIALHNWIDGKIGLQTWEKFLKLRFPRIGRR